MIKIENYNKTFFSKEGGSVKAIDNVSLDIKDGEKYGIIGYSGAGKSTLVRCINFLERPDSGKINIDGFGEVEISNGTLHKNGIKIKDKELRSLRGSMGMIFQHFNLLSRSTVRENVAYPLKYKGIEKREIDERVHNMLDLVGLSDKENVYPDTLSGGQKQRVSIARALINNPKILLSDEATSALDPDATESILNLLNELNKKLGLTMVVITHEMSVIKSLCDSVSVMENGRIVESGSVYEIFSSPKENITKKFVSSVSTLGKIDSLIEKKNSTVSTKEGEHLIRLTFGSTVDQPVISKVSREFGVDCNIALANVEVIGERSLGSMIVKLSGEDENVKSAVEFLRDNDVKVEDVNE